LKLLSQLFFVMLLVTVVGLPYWATQPISTESHEFTIKTGSSLRSSSQQIAAAGVPVNPWLMELLARITSQGTRFKAGTFEAQAGITPYHLIAKIVRGDFSQFSLTIIEGWTFKQMRQEIDQQTDLRHDTANLSDQAILSQIKAEYPMAEGVFYPDTYLIPKGASDLDVYKQAYARLQKNLNDAWSKRDTASPLKTPYEALILASIVEKETGQHSERTMIAGVFANRLRLGMPLQTDPTVIYGMGQRYQGKIHKSDLLQDTAYNTYTRGGLPPTPIALPGAQSILAALHPAMTDALYFVARGDGKSHFSSNLNDHNQAVNKYQR